MATIAPMSSRRARRMASEGRAVMAPPNGSMGRRQSELLFRVADPAPQLRITAEIKTALMREARVGQQRHVRQRERAHKKARHFETALHVVEREIAAPNLLRIKP